ncbi:MAG: hypothetical protein FD143_2865 [Ignavibacteria bacterium]|nr:MAG: hypothetical protein FD143_2865 [Ignavibacteria bacterium]KAF0155457.1 MAG: hypothetical protein FD188_3135 [Ignavibacteria bacterium]
MHKAAFHPAFKRDVKNLPLLLIEKLKNRLDEIQINPFSYEKLKGKLNEISKIEVRHLGVEYRLAFYVQKDSVVFLMFSKRENFYDYLKRRIR